MKAIVTSAINKLIVYLKAKLLKQSIKLIEIYSQHSCVLFAHVWAAVCACAFRAFGEQEAPQSTK